MKRDARNSVEGLGVPALRTRSADEDTGDADPQQHDHPDDDDAGDDEAVSWMPFDHYAIPVKTCWGGAVVEALDRFQQLKPINMIDLAVI